MLTNSKVLLFAVLLCHASVPCLSLRPPSALAHAMPSLPTLAGTGVHEFIFVPRLCARALLLPFSLSAFVVLLLCLLLPTISRGTSLLSLPAVSVSICRTCLCAVDRHTTHRAGFVFICAIVLQPCFRQFHSTTIFPLPPPSPSPSWPLLFLVHTRRNRARYSYYLFLFLRLFIPTTHPQSCSITSKPAHTSFTFSLPRALQSTIINLSSINLFRVIIRAHECHWLSPLRCNVSPEPAN